MGWSLRSLRRPVCGVRLIGLVTAILGAIAGANLVLILLDMARARSTDNRISADPATDMHAASSKPETPPALRRTDRHTTNEVRDPPPVVTAARQRPGPQHRFRNVDNAANVREARCDACSQTVDQPPRTVADIGDPAHAPDATLARIPRQRFCPDTEGVIASMNVTDA